MELVLIRGLPGSGKSTMAAGAEFQEFEHYEADMFFLDGSGAYNYQREKIQDAHAWCRAKTWTALEMGKKVVVCNTFTRLNEMEPYMEMCRRLGIVPRVIEATGNWPNQHGVPQEMVERMRKRWEPLADMKFQKRSPTNKHLK